jgi:hypothetical protein
MVDPHPNLGYNHGGKILWNMEAIQAKEVAAKEKEPMVREKEAATKGRKATVNIKIVHK